MEEKQKLFENSAKAKNSFKIYQKSFLKFRIKPQYHIKIE